MGKVHPGMPSASPASSSSSSQERDTYTVWMKSLVFNGNGFTVYDSHGNLVYRIDNYDSKCSSQVFLMDLKGNVLCTLLRKKVLKVVERWNGYKGEGIENDRAWFQVKKISNFFYIGSRLSCQVTMEGERSQASCIRIHGSTKNYECQIINGNGIIVAEAKRKEASKGVMLGNDVLSLKVEPHVDHSLIMALLVVHGLISHQI